MRLFIFVVIFCFFSCMKPAAQSEKTEQENSTLQETQQANTTWISTRSFDLDSLVKILTLECNEFDAVPVEFMQLKAFLRLSNGRFLAVLGTDQTSQIKQAKGDPYLNIFVWKDEEKFYSHYLPSAYADDLRLIDSSMIQPLFVNLNSLAGGAEYYAYNSSKQLLYKSKPFPEKKTEIAQISAKADTLYLTNSKEVLDLISIPPCLK